MVEEAELGELELELKQREQLTIGQHLLAFSYNLSSSGSEVLLLTKFNDQLDLHDIILDRNVPEVDDAGCLQDTDWIYCIGGLHEASETVTQWKVEKKSVECTFSRKTISRICSVE